MCFHRLLIRKEGKSVPRGLGRLTGCPAVLEVSSGRLPQSWEQLRIGPETGREGSYLRSWAGEADSEKWGDRAHM